MKHIPNIVGGLLGLAFIFFGLNYFGKWVNVGGDGKPSEAVISFFGAVIQQAFSHL